MRFEEVAPGALGGHALRAISGVDRLQYTAAFLTFAAGALPAIGGPGARLGVLAAIDGDGPVAAIPMVRTSPQGGPRPFPMDVEDHFFGLWIRNIEGHDRALRARALLSAGFGAILAAWNPSLRRALIFHAPLSPVSDALVAPRLEPGRRAEVLRGLVTRGLEIAAAEGRCAFLPRVERRAVGAWGGALAGFMRVPGYSNAELLPLIPPDRRVRQMIRRNARLMERASVTVETSRAAPPGFPFGALFTRTASRHRDPAPRLDDEFFRQLGARFSPRVRYLCARREGRPVGFVAVLEQGTGWEAFKCGTDRDLAGPAPVYLDLLFGKLRDMAAAEGVARVDLGAGELAVKRHYGAVGCDVDSFLAWPPGFRGRRAFTAYLRAVGEGIAGHEGAAGSLSADAAPP